MTLINHPAFVSVGTKEQPSQRELELLAPWNENVQTENERRNANESDQSYVNCQGAPDTEK